MSGPIIGRLAEGPVDIVGDVHGELDVLRVLLEELGYSRTGEHRDGRTLVFVGDLCDRGPDSLSVVRWVRDLVSQGRAQCILGNHELNLIRGERKEGNRWFYGEPEPTPCGQQALASEGDRTEILQFFESLPVALEREDLRVVHACWNEDALARLHAHGDKRAALAHSAILPEDVASRAREVAVDLHDPQRVPELHPHLVEAELWEQNQNPVKIVTSGIEEPTSQPFWAGGRWRVVRRARWWSHYEGPMTVIGHYWRSLADGSHSFKGESLFEDKGPLQPLGQAGRVMCVDYSIGRRWRERIDGAEPRTALGAYRWPEGRVHLASA